MDNGGSTRTSAARPARKPVFPLTLPPGWADQPLAHDNPTPSTWQAAASPVTTWSPPPASVAEPLTAATWEPVVDPTPSAPQRERPTAKAVWAVVVAVALALVASVGLVTWWNV